MERKVPVSQLLDVLKTPLGALLGGVHPDVFGKKPRLVATRELARDMTYVLSGLQKDKQYAVLTNRGAPSFLLVPIDPESWTSLLAATAPQFDQTDEGRTSFSELTTPAS